MIVYYKVVVIYSAASVIVYYKGCAELTTVGPTWYFLEAIGHQNNSFLTPKVRSGAVLKENVRKYSKTHLKW